VLISHDIVDASANDDDSFWKNKKSILTKYIIEEKEPK